MSVQALTPIFVAAAATTFHAVVADDECTARPIGELYKDGVDMCQVMWNDAFEVVDDNVGYTMWFFDEVNPNDAMSAVKSLDGADKKCYIDDYNHKNAPSKEDLSGECGAFRGNSCCAKETVPDHETLKGIYGEPWHWDRCSNGKMSQQCERFFSQEACMYECDPNAGYWRKYVEEGMPELSNRTKYIGECNPNDERYYKDAKDGEEYVAKNIEKCGKSGHNRWQLYKMPIKRSYCNSWYEACKNEIFCGRDYFKCARKIEEVVPVSVVVEEEVLTIGAIVGIAVATVVAVAAIIAIVVLISKERRGAPMFTKLSDKENEMM